MVGGRVGLLSQNGEFWCILGGILSFLCDLELQGCELTEKIQSSRETQYPYQKYQGSTTVFLRATALYAKRVYATPIPSVRPSVCPSVRLSHACIVSKRLNVSSKFFHRLIGPSF